MRFPRAGIIFLVLIGIFALFLVYRQNTEFPIPIGETIPYGGEDSSANDSHANTAISDAHGTLVTQTKSFSLPMQNSTREIFETNSVKHSIPLDEILSGGPPKDGIPSIDNPQFITTSEADNFLNSDSAGLGIVHEDEARFYPYQILVWHEIVNDSIAGNPILVTYCPLCATGIAFDRRVGDETREFGVSGKLWKSNLLMYDRTGNSDTESLWSQVLGEAVLGPKTGARLAVVPSDTVLYGKWKEKSPDTKVLSRKTGAIRTYGIDPYGDYYSDRSVSFGATFTDTRLHPKAFVLGVEMGGKYKAYHKDALPEGKIEDIFAEQIIRIEKNATGEITMTVNGNPLPYVGGFWFSWLAMHPDTELFK